MPRVPFLLPSLAALLLTTAAAADNKPAAAPVRSTYRITGLFVPEREADLREAFEKVPAVKLVSVDYDRAEAVVEYVPAKAFPGARPEQVAERLDNLLKGASAHTFGVRPLSTVPREKLQLVTISVAGLDCRACELAAYEAVARLDGVERATASFRDGRVTALIDPAKTDRARLTAALRQRGVDTPSAEK